MSTAEAKTSGIPEEILPRPDLFSIAGNLKRETWWLDMPIHTCPLEGTVEQRIAGPERLGGAVVFAGVGAPLRPGP